MANPFHYGEVVRGSDFTDREDELKSLVSQLAGPIRIFLVSPRRYGKTSLITKTLEQLQAKGILTVYVDLFRASSIEEFVEIYAKSLFSSIESGIEKTIRFIKEMLPTLSPEVMIDEEGKPSLSLGLKHERDRSIQDIFELPERIAKKRGKRVVVAFDEFQELTEFGGTKIEKTLRSYIQDQRSVSYLFAGSKRHLLTDMVMNRNRAFYASGKLMGLNKIPEDLFSAYIKDRFRRTGYKTDNETVEAILRATDNVPNNVQMLCHELWDVCRDHKRVEAADIQKAIVSLVKTRSILYSAAWDVLSLHQRKVLKAIAQEGDIKAPTSADFIRRHQLAAATSVQRSVERLIEREILDKQEASLIFTDPFFKEWIRSVID